MKVERVSYDVITPSAARGILTAIYWKPEIRWVIDRLHVLKPIRFTSVRRNEVSVVAPIASIKQAMNGNRTELGVCVEDVRQQRAATVLRDVDYAIEAHFELIGAANENTAKHAEMFRRRASKGQCFHTPYLGTREFPAAFELLERQIPPSALHGSIDLGWMLYDIDFDNDSTPMFFRARMVNGVIDVADARAEGVVS